MVENLIGDIFGNVSKLQSLLSPWFYSKGLISILYEFMNLYTNCKKNPYIGLYKLKFDCGPKSSTATAAALKALHDG